MWTIPHIWYVFLFLKRWVDEGMMSDLYSFFALEKIAPLLTSEWFTDELPTCQIGFLSEWQIYAQQVEGESWVGEKIDQGKLQKLSGKSFSPTNLSRMWRLIHVPSSR